LQRFVDIHIVIGHNMEMYLPG